MSRIPLSPVEPQPVLSLPPGVPTVYTCGLVIARLRGLVRWLQDDRFTTHERRPPWILSIQGVPYWAEACGLTVVTGRTRLSTKPFWNASCEVCHALERRLILNEENQWACRHCWPTWDQAGPILPIADLAFAYRIGLTTQQPVRLKRATIVKQLSRVGKQARTIEDVWLLGAGAGVLGWTPPRKYRKHRPRNPRGQFGGRAHPRGQLWDALAPHFLEATVNAVLHPAAFKSRFPFGN